jgi:amino acid adenylation domain-containing protein
MGRKVMPFDAEQSLPAHFRAQVAVHGGRTAIGTGDWRPTYAELDATANRFAHTLIHSGAKPSDCAAILMRHDGPQIAALLAALKAGAVVVVLNRTDPPARLRAIIAATEPTLIVTDADSAKLAAEVWHTGSSMLQFDPRDTRGPSQNPAIDLSPHATAFLMYTSGSSGQPKIVMQTHRFVLHNALRHTVTQRLQPDDRIALLAALSGAQGMGTAWSALANGASLFLHATMEKGVTDLASWLNHHQITIYVSASSVHRHFMRTLDDQTSFPSVRLVQITSEWATAEDFRTYLHHFPQNCEFIHGLGSSETGNVTRMRLVHGDVVEDGRLPIGQPSEGMDVLIVDEAGRPVAPGETGEMMVRSRFLTGGYWRDEALTRERFSSDPTSGLMTYRGGDLARVNARGLLEFMGRKDAAVKVGGFYVEPSTVEAALLQLASVERAAVVPWNRPNGEAQLAAYVLLRAGQKSSAAAIRRALRDILPRHIVPSIIRFPDAIPLTPQGKVDRERLKQDRPAPSANAEAEPPATATEALVAEAWLAEFDVDHIGRHDDFFDLGGDSLIAAVVAAKVHAATGVELHLVMFADHPTLSELAALIDRRRGMAGSEPPLVRVPRDGPLPLSFAQERAWKLSHTDGRSHSETYVTPYRIVGPLDRDLLRDCMSELVRRHENIRTTFTTVDGTPMQIVHDPEPVDLQTFDLAGAPDPERHARRIFEAAATHPLDLTKLPLWFFVLIRLRDGEHWLLRICHHIVYDALSSDMYFRELAELYTARRRGETPALPVPPELQYGGGRSARRGRLVGPRSAGYRSVGAAGAG